MEKGTIASSRSGELRPTCPTRQSYLNRRITSPDAGIEVADPNGDERDDHDAEDSDDPLMVNEYVIEILDYRYLPAT